MKEPSLLKLGLISLTTDSGWVLGLFFFQPTIPIRSLKQRMESALGRKSHFRPECPGATVPQMWVFRSESEVGVRSLSKALTTMRLVSVGSINPSSPSWPTVS